MTFTARNERGMALALALVVLVLVGVLAATICFVGVQEARMGESMRRLEHAFGAAEGGAATVIRTRAPPAYNIREPDPFDSSPVPDGYPGAWAGAAHQAGAYGGHIYRLNGELFFISVVGRDSRVEPGAAPDGQRRQGEALQRVALLARVRPVRSGVTAALTAGTRVRLSGAVTVDGSDRTPPGWEPCGPPDSQQAGIRVVGGLGVWASGAASILGTPPIITDSAPAAPVAVLAGIVHDQLAAWATYTLAGGTFAGEIGPVVVADRCAEDVATNWGDSRGHNYLCGNYFPIVHITGDATVSGVRGQGILVADGNVLVNGGLEWYGVALVRGSLTVLPDRASNTAFWGAVLVEDSVILQGAPDKSVAVTYSKCAITKALESVARLRCYGVGDGWAV
jgi:hypothetical protein